MPRSARIILPGIAHHLTQRGNNRVVTFFNDADYIAYLTFLHEQAGKHLVVVEGYCLMPNHVHLVLIPPDEMSLARAIGRTHYCYTQYFNFTYQRSGHLWQNRFYSCALDEAHYWKALCYIRAHLVEAATAYRWSSAAAHLGASDETGLLDIAAWQARMPAEDWCE